MPNRTRVSETRTGIIRKNVNACGYECYVNVSFYEDGEPSEVFITIAKRGHVISGFAKALAVLMSVMFQYHIPWVVVYNKLRGMKFDPQDEKYTSLVDAIVNEMNIIIVTRKEQENE